METPEAECHTAGRWIYTPSQITQYLSTRISSLKPPNNVRVKNPIQILKLVNNRQWLMFFVGYLGWICDSFDILSMSLTITDIAKTFNVPNSQASWGLTITLMCRSLGALLVGSLSDRFGRKWPFICMLIAMIILEIGAGFTKSLSHFLGVRALMGIAMGGLFGTAAATALEDLPYETHGILSGFFEQGYCIGYLLATVCYRLIVPTTGSSWRSLYWLSVVLPVFTIVFRLLLPETNHFKLQKAERDRRQSKQDTDSTISRRRGGIQFFLEEAGSTIKQNYLLLIFMVIMMAGFNACSHGSQDLYPTFLKDDVDETPTDTALIIAIGQIGELIGGNIAGYLSSIIGRRLTMICACIGGGAVIPAYIGFKNLNLVAPAFFEQFFLGSLWGPVPIYLMELAPPAFRSLVVGMSHQLGNLVASASVTIESTIGEKYPLPPAPDGTRRYEYGKAIGIFLGAAWIFSFVMLLLGPEMRQENRSAQTESQLCPDEGGIRTQESLEDVEKGHARGVDVLNGESKGCQSEPV